MTNKCDNICFVIPCYNEESRMNLSEYSAFLLKQPDVSLCFVNDGSTDGTFEELMQFQIGREDHVWVVNYQKNVGKAEAIRRGVKYCSEHVSYNRIGYLDADLSTTLEECMKVAEYIDEEVLFCFGSRIMKIGSTIERSTSRFLIGRVIATAISNILHIKVYDTQCGCKIIEKNLADILFDEPFVSRWLFDVELFARVVQIYGRPDFLSKMLEIPLVKWVDKGESKVKFSYGFKLWFDLYSIKRKYRKTLSAKFKPKSHLENNVLLKRINPSVQGQIH